MAIGRPVPGLGCGPQQRATTAVGDVDDVSCLRARRVTTRSPTPGAVQS
jgi:hypothetical protein